MKSIVTDGKSLYIEPIGLCNLNCKMCYTSRYKERLAKDQLVGMIDSFSKTCKRFRIYWCGGGEVFLHKDFPFVVSYVRRRYPQSRQTIQTNGMLPSRLDEIKSLDKISFRVSIDMPESFHLWNRGKESFSKAIEFCRRAYERGAFVEVRTLLTMENMKHLDKIEDQVKKTVGKKAFLSATPIMLPKDVKCEEYTKKKAFLSNKLIRKSPLEIKRMLRTVYGGRFVTKENGSTYVSACPRGFFTCCEMKYKIGDIGEDMDIVKGRLKEATAMCNKCSLLKYCLF